MAAVIVDIDKQRNTSSDGAQPMPFIVIEPLLLPPEWSRPCHRDVFNELVFVLKGEKITHIRGEDLRSGPRTAVLHPIGVEHSESLGGGVPLEMLYVYWEQETRRDLWSLPLQAVDRTGRVEMCLRWMLELSEMRTLENLQTMNWLLQSVLTEISATGPSRKDDLVRAVTTYVRVHLSEQIDLDDLADSVCMSRFHFSRTFTRVSGQPPMEFIRQMRVTEARRLLVSSSESIQEIANKVGFNDATHFGRVFNRICGFPPSTVRNLNDGK